MPNSTPPISPVCARPGCRRNKRCSLHGACGVADRVERPDRAAELGEELKGIDLRAQDTGLPSRFGIGAPRLPQGAPSLVIRETSAMAGEGSCAPGSGRRVKANRLSPDSGAGGSTRSRRGGRHRGQRLDKASVTAISSLAGAGHLIENHLLQLPYGTRWQRAFSGCGPMSRRQEPRNTPPDASGPEMT